MAKFGHVFHCELLGYFEGACGHDPSSKDALGAGLHAPAELPAVPIASSAAPLPRAEPLADHLPTLLERPMVDLAVGLR